MTQVQNAQPLPLQVLYLGQVSSIFQTTPSETLLVSYISMNCRKAIGHSEKQMRQTWPPFAPSVLARVQIAQMVRTSTPRSLLLIDEFGKGTAPADGIGLVAALLRHLSRKGRKCLFTLHFQEIFRCV